MFNFVRKLFKALNSSGKSWQLSVSIVLAMFAGFLPSNSLILLDILFIALILNINFGLFLLFSVIFSGIGYIFDPLFESIGYSILTNESLNGFFTTLYNSALFRWSSFNYTLVTGALVVSSILAFPLLFLLNKSVSLYRVQIGEKLNEWKLTRWMKLFNEDVKSSSLFRWWGLGVFGGLTAIIILFAVLLFDPLARFAIEKSLSYTLQTEVNVKDFDSDFSDLKIKISGIEVSDKEKLTHNLVQVADIEFDLGFSALLDKKAMVEYLGVNGVAFNTQRETPAQAYDSSTSGADTQAGTTDETGSTDDTSSQISNPFSLPNVDDILAKEELISILEAQKLKADIQETKDKWAKVSEELKGSNEIDVIKKDAAALQKSLSGADISKITSLKSDIDALKAKISGLKSKYSTLQKEFKADQKGLKTRIYALKSLPQKDLQRLKKRYSLSAGGGANIIGTLLNKEINGYVQTALKYYSMLKPYLNDGEKAQEKDLEPPRGQGRWIKYANHTKMPEVVIKEAKINFLLEDDTLDVQIKEFSSNQKLYGKAMTLHADAQGSRYKHIVADIIDDRRELASNTRFDVIAQGFKSSQMDMDVLSVEELVSDASLNGTIVDMIISAKSNINVKQAKLQMPSQKLINDLLAGVSTFNVDIGLSGDVKAPSVTVKTDLDKQLSKGMSSMLAKESKKFERDLKDGIMKKVSGSSDGLNTDLGDTSSLLNGKQDALGGINTDFTSSSGSGSLLKKFF